jgi:hypothetical protein
MANIVPYGLDWMQLARQPCDLPSTVSLANLN